MNARTLPSDLTAAALGHADTDGAAMVGASDAIALLMSRAAPHMTPGELRALVDISQDAEQISTRAAKVARGLAMLVLADGNASSGHAGNFQSGGDVSELMEHFADTFEQVAILIRVGADASSLLESTRTRKARGLHAHTP